MQSTHTLHVVYSDANNTSETPHRSQLRADSPKGQKSTESTRNSRSREEQRHTTREFFSLVPHRDVKVDTREETGFSETEEEAGAV
jgi:hypothetical protein